MAINNESLVKFGYGVASKAVKDAGHITFAYDTRQLFVGDGSTAVAFAGNVANAVFAGKKLTITYNDGTPAAVLDFSDVASAEGVSSLLGGLRKDVEANKTAIATETTERQAADASLAEVIDNLNTALGNLDSSYKAADALLDERIEALEGLVGEGGDVDERIADAIEALDSSIRADFAAEDATIRAEFAAKDASIRAEFADADASLKSYVDTKVSNLGGSETGADASSFVTVTVNTTAGEVSGVTVVGKDIASASDLSDVSTRLDAFLNGEGLADTVDTLKDIQAWINGDGVNATELTQAIAEEADLRAKADASIRTDFAVADATTLASAKSYADGLAVNYDASGAAATAESNAKAHSDANLATAKTYAEGQASTAKSEAISAAAGDATSKANKAEANAKGYADTQITAIKVNGVTIKDASLDGTHIKVGGTDTHSSTTVSIAIEDLYSKVEDASNAARVESLAVNSESSNYASVNAATGAVTLTIKKVALKDASESNTGVADAYDVKTSIATAKSEAISAVQGEESDASTAATVAGAKAYADAQIDANALRWTVLS